jgi:hypothetical protein
MAKKDTVIEKNYKIQVAGELWTIPEICFFRDAKGLLYLSKEEIDKINRSIANFICSDNKELTWEQFDFLCKSTATKYSKIAEMLRIDKSTVSKWKSSKLDFLASFVLKQYFWNKIFAEYLNEKTLDTIELQLGKMGKKAIEEKWTISINRAA